MHTHTHPGRSWNLSHHVVLPGPRMGTHLTCDLLVWSELCPGTQTLQTCQAHRGLPLHTCTSLSWVILGDSASVSLLKSVATIILWTSKQQPSTSGAPFPLQTRSSTLASGCPAVFVLCSHQHLPQLLDGRVSEDRLWGCRKWGLGFSRWHSYLWIREHPFLCTLTPETRR